MKSRNEKAITALTEELQSMGFSVIDKNLFKKRNLELKIHDQEREGIELYVKHIYGLIRVDFLLEYYFSQKVELSRERYRKEITQLEFHTQLLKRYTTELSKSDDTMKRYLEWKSSLKSDVEEIRQMIFKG